MTNAVRIALSTFLLATAALVAAPPVEAVTCSSTCGQVQRACKQLSKHAWDQARYECRQEENACHADCDATVDSCPADCAVAADLCNTACADAPDPGACEADCASANEDCLTACANCDADCDAAGAACKDQARTDRSAARDACATAREDCLAVCVDPIDSDCVRACTSDEHGCGASAKRNYRDCKRACDRGEARRPCTKACKNDFAAAREACSNATILCLAGPDDSCINPAP